MIETIARVRRAMPRNADVMAICDDWERQAAELREANKKPVDRKTYMREYMRNRRKAEQRAQQK